MNAVNELSCEFAASVFARMNTTDNKIEPQVALAVIRNFYDALRPLMSENSRSIEKKLIAHKLAERSAGGH